MTTSMLPPLLPDVGTKRAAFILESLEDEVRRSGATFGLLIDRAGQIVASDIPGGKSHQDQMLILATRLVPIFLASRTLSRTFREWPIRGTVEESGGMRLLTQPILDHWLLAMAFPIDGPQLATEQLTRRWLTRLSQLVPDRTTSLRVNKAGRTITRDSVDLLFCKERDDDSRDEQGGA